LILEASSKVQSNEICEKEEVKLDSGMSWKDASKKKIEFW
jgi:hypothetical protein